MKFEKEDFLFAQAPGRALLAMFPGQRATTLQYVGAEFDDIALHARHRRSRVLVRAWSSNARARLELAKPYRDQDFVDAVARCMARVMRAERQLRASHEARLEWAMRHRLARRDHERAGRSIERPRLLERVRRLIFFL